MQRALPDRGAARAHTAVAMPQGLPGMAAKERARKTLVAAVLLIYLLAIFEGSLRKWVLPQFSQYIFFIRDPVLLYVYLLATQAGLWPRRSAWLQLSWLLAGLGVVLVVVQAAVGGFSDTRLLLAVYGWRSYFFYLPLAFLIGDQFRRADLARFAKLTLLLAVPIAALVTLQFYSPINSPINVGLASDAEFQFRGLGLNGEHTRPMGPFSSGAGQQQFVATATVFLLAFALLPAARRGFSSVLLGVAAAAVMVCAALSGSRGTVLQCVLAGVFAVLLGLIGRGAALKFKALTLPALLGLTALVLYPIVFPEGFAAFTDRWTNAGKAESNFQGGVFGRALYGFVDFIRLVDAVPALGYGLGYGGNASITLRAEVDGVKPGNLAETDFARHMVDLGPALGMGFIVLRVTLALWLARRVWRATRASADPMPLLLFSYASYAIMLGQITGQGAINVYAWLFTGLCIAACQQARIPSSGPTSVVPLPRRPGALRAAVRAAVRRPEPRLSTRPLMTGTQHE